jgi:hypothetical protein
LNRISTISWLLLTLIVLFLLIGPSLISGKPLSRPTSEDQRTSGLAALAGWLRSADVPVVSIAQRLNEFEWGSVAPTGNIAILHLPGTLEYQADEARVLMQWIAQGNRLLIVGGFLESSAWTTQVTDINRSLWRLTGTHITETRSSGDAADPDDTVASQASLDSEKDSSSQLDFDQIATTIDNSLNLPGWLLLHGSRETIRVTTSDSHTLFAGLPVLELPWNGKHWRMPDYEADRSQNNSDKESKTDTAVPDGWRRDQLACTDDGHATWLGPGHIVYGREGCIEVPSPAPLGWQTIMAHEGSGQPAMFETGLGAGQIWLLLHPSLLDNDVMHRWSNREFVQRLVDKALDANGSVVLDDAHQGLNTIVEVGDLLTDSRLYASIGFLLLFWLGYLLADAGQWQSAIYRPALKVARQVELVEANGSFLRNRLQRDSVCTLILEPLQAHLSRKWGLSRDNALARGLALERKHHPEAVAALERALSKLQAGQTVDPLILKEQVYDLDHRIG